MPTSHDPAPLRFSPVLLLVAALSAVDLPAEDTAESPPPLKVYRDAAMGGDGDRVRGQRLFHDARASCALCHSVDGSNRQAGPDLGAAGDKFSRTDLIRSVLEPSASIMMGYSTTIVETHAGERVSGIVKSVSDRELILAGVGEVRHRVARDAIKSQETSALSLMPDNLHAALSIDEFVDLVSYLESLKQPAGKLATARGTPREIPKLLQPITLRPFLKAEHAFHKPIWFGEHPRIADTYIVAEQGNARIWLVEKRGEGETKTLFADVRGEVFVTENEGLLGFALHPHFQVNRKYYIMHEILDGQQRALVIAERTASADTRVDANPTLPSRRLLRIDATTEVHHGGGIAFGPDGFLYIGMGDGGPQEDPHGHGQDLGTLEGKLSRIDVDRRDPGLAYAIPPSNPFAKGGETYLRREIFAYGLRQAWRFSFDPANGDLWVGDVGQNRFEEITIVRAGENHGWNVYEGFELFSTAHRKPGAVYTQPVVSFRRHQGFSVTGGYVYRADPQSTFHGVYICGDYETKRLWGIVQRDRKLQMIREIGSSPAKIVAFGRDRHGELYVVGYDNGMIYQIDFADAVFQ